MLKRRGWVSIELLTEEADALLYPRYREREREIILKRREARQAEKSSDQKKGGLHQLAVVCVV